MQTTQTDHHSYAQALTSLSMLTLAGYSLASGMLACQIFKAQTMAGSLATQVLTGRAMSLFVQL
jgi:hypothetical protein